MGEEEKKTEEEKKEEEPEFEKKLKEMRVENDRMEKNIAELKELKAIDALSGETPGGQATEKPKEDTPEEYSKKLLAGEIKEEDAS